MTGFQTRTIPMRTRFWSLPTGTRFRDDETMWGFIKIGWCTVQLVDSKITARFAPWTMVDVVRDEEDEELAGSYHDGHTIPELRKFIDNPVELIRLNLHRGSTLIQPELDRIIREAIKMRKADKLP